MDRKYLTTRKLLAFASRRPSVAKPGSRRRHVLTVLLLAFVMGSTHQPLLAQAAGETYWYFMGIGEPKTTLCQGERVSYTVYVYGIPDARNGMLIELPGVKVEAYPADQSIGKFTGANKAGFATQPTGMDMDELYNANFEFTAAKKIGTSQLFFEGAVKGINIKTGYVSATVPVKVIACKFRVWVETNFPPNGTYNPMIVEPPITVKMDPTVVTADANGHFTGSARLSWVGHTQNPKPKSGTCSVVQKFESTITHADISGQISADGTMVELSLTYQQPVSASLTVTCDGVSEGQPDASFVLDPLKLSVPLYGGAFQLDQSYSQGSFMGYVDGDVVPVK